MDEQTQPTSEPATNQLQPSDLVYVSEITRSQDERIESFCAVLRDQSRNHKIGHGIMIFETEVDGKARLMYTTNTELQELKGKTGLWRAEELVLLAARLIEHSGIPKLDVGYEAGLEYSRKIWAAVAAEESK